jgi:hypothetical protein
MLPRSSQGTKVRHNGATAKGGKSEHPPLEVVVQEVGHHEHVADLHKDDGIADVLASILFAKLLVRREPKDQVQEAAERERVHKMRNARLDGAAALVKTQTQVRRCCREDPNQLSDCLRASGT